MTGRTVLHLISIPGLVLPLWSCKVSSEGVVDHPSKLRFDDLDFTPPDAAKHRHVLPSGVVVYVVEDRSLPLVDVDVVIRAGAYLDPPGRAGLASALGSLLRSGGAGDSSPEAFDEEVDFLAAIIDVTLGDDRGNASLNCLTKDLDRTLELFFSMLRRPGFDLARLELHRKRTLQNLARRNDSSASIEAREWQRLLRGPDHHANDHRTDDSIRAITRDDLLAFHAAHIHPRNFIIAVSGDVETEEVLATLEKHLTDWGLPDATTPLPPPPGPPASPGVYIVDKPDVNQGRVRVGHIGLRRDHPDEHAVRIMNYILGGGGFVSRIMSRVRSDEGLAYSARSRFSFGDRHAGEGEFRAYFQSKSPSCAQAAAIVLEEIRRIREEDVSDEEVRAAISNAVNVFPRFFAQASQVASTFADDEFTGREEGFWASYRDRVRAVTVADVRRVAKEHLNPDDLIVLFVGNRNAIVAGNPDKPEFSVDKIAAGRTILNIPLADALTLERTGSTRNGDGR